MTTTTDELYGDLPEYLQLADDAYRDPADPLALPLKRYLSLTGDELHELRELIELIATGGLGDPYRAPARALPWLAQRGGVTLDPRLTEAEQRDAIAFASSGWRAGNRESIEDAAGLRLEGTRYARFYPHSNDVDPTGTRPWYEGLLITRPSETPDVTAVLLSVDAMGAKPFGVHLYHRAYEASWDVLEAAYPTSDAWDAAASAAAGGWDNLQETGAG